ncbi:SDR family oxidoreductase [Salinibacterium sp.]|uniref:SDR family NAD(P)-dependent oxidoreductase n=1 Tax=Salinibacterium sp. TaxID=1915057 RepID=UPI00286D1FD4|nr:SDR family oxidoreductase [Salinibacterium sp.]
MAEPEIVTDFLGLGGRTALVTGASSGIGRAVALQASRQGMRVALVGRVEHSLHEVEGNLHGTGHLVVPFDLTDLEGIQGMVANVRDYLGPLDALVHSAGAHSVAPLRTVKPAAAESLLTLNVTTAIMLSKAFRAKTIHTASASLVLLSSVAALAGQPAASLYSATKGAITALSRSLAVELARDGVRVNSVAPGIVDTPLTEGMRAELGSAGFERVVAAHPLGLGTPDDVAAAVLYLISPVSRWVTGSTLVIDGGYTAQ